jgi:hypothetical protein
LERVGSRVRGRYADCPVCGKGRKLGILEMRDGGSIWLKCFKDCESKDVIAVLGLDFRDLFEHRFTPERIHGLDVDRARARRDGEPIDTYEAIESFKFTATSRCFPSEGTIAGVVGKSRRQVVRDKARLRELGWLDWCYGRAPRARWRHCVYQLRLTWVAPLRKALLAALDRLTVLRKRVPWTRTVPFSETRRSRSRLEPVETFDFRGVKPWIARAGPSP